MVTVELLYKAVLKLQTALSLFSGPFNYRFKSCSWNAVLRLKFGHAELAVFL